jgi:hypothetical protein
LEKSAGPIFSLPSEMLKEANKSIRLPYSEEKPFSTTSDHSNIFSFPFAQGERVCFSNQLGYLLNFIKNSNLNWKYFFFHFGLIILKIFIVLYEMVMIIFGSKIG